MTTIAATDNKNSLLTEYQWTPQPQAERLVKELLDAFLARNAEAAGLAREMVEESGTRFHDWIDHIVARGEGPLATRLIAAGYSPDASSDGTVFRHHGGIFPPVIVTSSGEAGVAIKVESVVDFLARHQITFANEVEGDPGAPLRRALAFFEPGAMLWVIERHGSRGFTAEFPSAVSTVYSLRHAEAFHRRVRGFRNAADGFAFAERLIDRAIGEIGRDWACDLFFAAERTYWMRRNRAAQVQYARQQRLGLGWANHDHHTYRCSREHFARLVTVWEKLGFVCRERFYAGAEAGWGAQVMEHPVTGIVTFNDVDLSPDELMQDFAHDPLEPRKELGTVGLWCALHGESFLEAGMHHLECMFDFEALRKQLESDHAIKTMKPFTDFPHLRQAFTEGERWPVRPERIDRLLAGGRITADQAEKFRTE